MTERAAPLTTEQKRICRANSGMFASDIAKLPGMEKTTKRQISDYLRTPENNPHKALADMLEAHIADNGLPSQYSSGVIGYIRYLRSKS